MRGYRFYEEFTPGGTSLGTVVAVLVDRGAEERLEALVSIDGSPDGVVGPSVATSRRYLRRCCRRVPESKARAIHPALFADIDARRRL